MEAPLELQADGSQMPTAQTWIHLCTLTVVVELFLDIETESIEA
jgi:hypothetical protein